LDVYVTIPKYFDASTVDFSRCVGSGIAQLFLQKTNGARFNLFCRDGNKTTALMFVADKNSTYTF